MRVAMGVSVAMPAVPLPMIVSMLGGMVVTCTGARTAVPGSMHMLMPGCDDHVEQVQRHGKQRNQSVEAWEHRQCRDSR